MLSVNLVFWGIVGFLLNACSGAPALLSKTESITALTNDDVYDAFEKELLSKGVKEDFAQQLRDNLKKAIMSELKQAQLRQGVDEEDDDEDETEAPTTTTLGPSPLNIVNGIYGILSGVGTLNPDRIFSATVNFVPPSQRETAMALVSSALGMKTMFPTPTTTKLTSTTPSTTTKDDYYDEDEDETTKSAVAATSAPVVAVAVAATASPVAAVAASSGATVASASALPKYTVNGKSPAEGTPEVVASPATASPPLSATTLQDDEADIEPNLSHLTKL